MEAATAGDAKACRLLILAAAVSHAVESVVSCTVGGFQWAETVGFLVPGHANRPHGRLGQLGADSATAGPQGFPSRQRPRADGGRLSQRPQQVRSPDPQVRPQGERVIHERS